MLDAPTTAERRGTLARLPSTDAGTIARAVVIAALLAFVLFALPELTSTFWLKIATSVAIYSVVALGLGILYGRVGLVSLCQIALLAVGAWVTARLGYATSIPFPFLLLIAGVVTGVIGTLIGLPALRVSGLHLALITLMAAAAITLVFQKKDFPNGGGGFWGVEIEGRDMRRPDIALGDTAYFRYTVIAAAILFLLALWQVRARPGRAWAAIRESEPAALAAGVNVTVYKLWAFALASFMTGVAGGLFAGSVPRLTSSAFRTEDSIILLAVTLMGGIYTLWGAVVAGLLFKLLPELLQDWGLSSDITLILFGAGLLQVLATAPGGLAQQVPKDLANLGRLLARPFRRRSKAHEGST
jgi:branched-chain amino acid transport system permease protein